MKGKIVLIPFPFTDLTTAKLRPALVIHEGKRDVIVAFISSKTSQLSDVDVLILRGHPEFVQTGLKTDSILKLDKLATVLKELVIGELGELGSELKREVNDKLRKIFEV